MRVGDIVRVQGMSGVVVALISEGTFWPSYPASSCAHLKAGVLIETVEAGLIHYPNFDGVEIEIISD